LPDILLVHSEPFIEDLSSLHDGYANLLAYLHSVNFASAQTIAGRLGADEQTVATSLALLESIAGVQSRGSAFSLSRRWRRVLPEVITIEAKVERWRDAVQQARRNQIFAHQSFIALPKRIAQRISGEAVFEQTGIGVLSVDDFGDVSIVRAPVRTMPRVWLYYYQIALIVAKQYQGALQCLSLSRWMRRESTIRTTRLSSR